MHTQFHINWIGKQWIIDQLAAACGLRGATISTYVDADRIERSKKNQRAVILSLIAEGFMSRDIGEVRYRVRNKAFERIDAEDWTDGDWMLFPRTEGYGLRDISVGILKTILISLIDGRAVTKTLSTGDVVVTLTEDAQTSDEQKAEQWVFDNLPAIAHEVLDLSEATAQLVSLRGKAASHPLSELPLMLAETMDECVKEINKLKMRREAITMMVMRVEQAGGWDKFLTACQALQKLQVLSAEYAAPGKDEAVLREAAALYKPEQV